jgi:penicillin amidase
MLRALALVVCLSLFAFISSVAHATGIWSTIQVGTDEVRVFRDDFGRPHIFAKTNQGLFTAYGYAVAEDRLWQLELNRRASRGKLAEIFGARFIATDALLRTVGYTDAELNAQLAALSEADRQAFHWYADGINRYIVGIAADPVGRLPFEFFALGGALPADWSATDAAGVAAFIVSRFSDSGGRELDNAKILGQLIAGHGLQAGFAIFDDVRWLDDAASPVTIREDGTPPRKRDRHGAPSYLPSAIPETAHHEAHERLSKLPVPGKLGSYGWVVGPSKSAEGHAMLYGGPQMEYSAPEIVHEVQLTSEEGYNVTGMAIAGIPFVIIGRNRHLSWTLTSGLTADNIDIYLEQLCGPSPASGYNFKTEQCKPFEHREEKIFVRGTLDPVKISVLRSVHGPVVGVAGNNAATVKRAQWMTELDSIARVGAMGRAHNLQQFSRAVEGVSAAFNVLYADTHGNIGYWFVGRNPLRVPGFDPRLPLPGNGVAEWTGGFRPVLSSVNPPRGWLANWNNKATADYPGGDADLFGKTFRMNDLEERFQQASISIDDMRDIPKDIARVKGRTGREARFLKPYLFDALERVPPTHPLAAGAKQVLGKWDGNMFSDAVASTTLEAGEVIFSAWLARTVEVVFANALGDLLTVPGPDSTRVAEGTSNMLLHLLDDVLGDGSEVSPNLDYLSGRDANQLMSRAFDEVVGKLATAQGSDPTHWTAPRGFTDFNHPLLGRVARIPASNRATYAQIVQLDPRGIESENIYTLGQSGFIHFAPPGGFVLDPHFLDQNKRYTNFEYKKMPLLLD